MLYFPHIAEVIGSAGKTLCLLHEPISDNCALIYCA